MARHSGPVLVDTNVILESYRVESWRALAGGYRVETVEECVMETQTGFQFLKRQSSDSSSVAPLLPRRDHSHGGGVPHSS